MLSGFFFAGIIKRMPNPTGDQIQVRITRFINRKLKPGLVTWMDADLASLLINHGCAVVHAPTIHDVETR